MRASTFGQRSIVINNHLLLIFGELFPDRFGKEDHLSVGSPQVSFPMCTLEIPQKIAVQVLLLLTLFTFTFEPFLKLSFPQTMSLSCIFVFAPSFIRMDLSIVTSSTSLTFSGFLALFSSISSLFLCIESHLALSSARWHL